MRPAPSSGVEATCGKQRIPRHISYPEATLGRLGLELRRTRSAGAAFPADPCLNRRELLTGSGRTAPVIFDVGAPLLHDQWRYLVTHGYTPFDRYDPFHMRVTANPGSWTRCAALTACAPGSLIANRKGPDSSSAGRAASR